ncbi:MAG: hypothetical protein HON94_04985 [Methylococcales bacterium]|jgi:hypothetical protein|nr:hypothetical protein [Methylococcales bacterium]
MNITQKIALFTVSCLMSNTVFAHIANTVHVHHYDIYTVGLMLIIALLTGIMLSIRK